jgi:hypothetical protein
MISLGCYQTSDPTASDILPVFVADFGWILICQGRNLDNLDISWCNTYLVRPLRSPMIGQTISHYKILEKGAGSGLPRIPQKRRVNRNIPRWFSLLLLLTTLFLTEF